MYVFALVCRIVGLGIRSGMAVGKGNASAMVRTQQGEVLTDNHGVLFKDNRGVVFTEYIIVLGTISLAVGLALYALGVPLVRAYYLTKLFILLPFP